MLAISLSMLALCTAALPGESLYESARQAEREGRYADANALYGQATELNGPLAPYATIRAAVCRSVAGDPAGAQRALLTFLEEAEPGPWTAFAQHELAIILTQANEHEQAAIRFDQAIESDVSLWWMDDIRWKTAESRLAVPGLRPVGLEYFRGILRNGSSRKRMRDAAAYLRESDLSGDRLLAASGLFRTRDYKDATQLLATIAPELIDAAVRSEIKQLMARLLLATGKKEEGQAILRELAEGEDTEFARKALLYLVGHFVSAERFDDAETVRKSIEARYLGSSESVRARWRIAEGLNRDEQTDAALRHYDIIARNHGDHSLADDALMRAGHILRQDKKPAEANHRFSEVYSDFTSSSFRPEAAFWSGEMHLASADQEAGIQRLQSAVSLGMTNYYGHRAQQRLAQLEALDGPKGVDLRIYGDDPVIRPIPMDHGPAPSALETLAEDPRMQRLWFFARHGYPEGDWEALAIGSTLGKEPDSMPLYLAMGEAGTAYAAMQFAFAARLGQNDDGTQTVDRLRIRFPRAYWNEVRALAAETGIHPYLLLSIARQESTFRATVVSSAGAVGVMQLMPSTADWMVEKEETIDAKHAADLKNPSNSLRLGAFYIGRMLDRYNGSVVHALAAYNGGPTNCDKWRKSFGDGPIEEFIEYIPFTETRNYVKRILGYYATYHSIYPAAD